jgi:hypothetical protein
LVRRPCTVTGFGLKTGDVSQYTMRAIDQTANYATLSFIIEDALFLIEVRV